MTISRAWSAPSWMALAVGIALNLLFLISIPTGLLDPLFLDASYRAGEGADFYAVYEAGHNVATGVSAYDEPASGQSVTPYRYPFRYPPPAAFVIGLPMQLVGDARGAYVLWLVLLEVMLLVDVGLTFALFGFTDRGRMAASLWLLSSPLYLELFMGQFSLAMATMMLATLYLFGKRRPAAAAAVWLLSLVTKSMSAVLAPALVKKGEWKAVLGGLAAAVALCSAYFVAVPGSWAAFARVNLSGLTAETIAGNQGLPALLAISGLRFSGAFQRLLYDPALSEQVAESLRLPLLAWAALVVVLCAYVTWRARAHDWIALSCLWLLAYFLVYKHVWEHQYVLALPAFVMLLRIPGLVGGSRGIPLPVYWSAVIATALPTAFIAIDPASTIEPEALWTTAQSILWHAPKPMAIAVLAVALGIAIVRRASASTSRPS